MYRKLARISDTPWISENNKFYIPTHTVHGNEIMAMGYIMLAIGSEYAFVKYYNQIHTRRFQHSLPIIISINAWYIQLYCRTHLTLHLNKNFMSLMKWLVLTSCLFHLAINFIIFIYFIFSVITSFHNCITSSFSVKELLYVITLSIKII